MKKKLKILILLTLASAMLLTGCGSNLSGRMHYSLAYFGTETRIGVYDAFGTDSAASARLEDCWNEIKNAISGIEQSISAEISTSSVARFNAAAAGGTVEIDKAAYEVMTVAKDWYGLTGGAFDPATGLLVDLWGFSPRFSAKDYAPAAPYDRADPAAELPDEKYIDAFKSLTGFGNVELKEENGKYYAVKPDAAASVPGDGNVYSMQITLGGIGKGYAADIAGSIMRSYGYELGYASIGGSSIALLGYPDGGEKSLWTLPVTNPSDAGAYYAELYCMDVMVSTSGDYQHYYEIGGTRYSHTIDPFTGRPAQGGIVTATVLSASAAAADALTTAICAMDAAAASSLISASGADAMFAYKSADGYKVITNMPASGYKITDKKFHVA